MRSDQFPAVAPPFAASLEITLSMRSVTAPASRLTIVHDGSRAMVIVNGLLFRCSVACAHYQVRYQLRR